MNFRTFLLISALACLVFAGDLHAQCNDATNKLARNIYKQLIEISTTDSVGSTTVFSRAAGFPTNGIPGVLMDVDDDRSHGRDERIRVASFYEVVDFYYRSIKTLSTKQ